jgi:formylglycine-generating enzyme required for sulfatase activity
VVRLQHTTRGGIREMHAIKPTETEQYQVLSPDRIIWKQDGKEMVRVPAGKFLYGRKKEEHELPEFWIDRTPVTNAEYARFVAAIGHKPPRHWKGKSPPKDIADHPVAHVPWHDAVAYAEWAGKRLPTEEEWEKAARGTDGRECPWGDEFDKDKCNVKGSGIGDTTPVGKYSPAGDSPYGVADMVGNVREWTAGEYRPGSNLRVLRGAAFLDQRLFAYCACRHQTERYSWGRIIGFRLVVSLIS